MSSPSFFDWECFYHLDDFIGCVGQVLPYFICFVLFVALVFSLIVAIITYWKRIKVQEYRERGEDNAPPPSRVIYLR